MKIKNNVCNLLYFYFCFLFVFALLVCFWWLVCMFVCLLRYLFVCLFVCWNVFVLFVCLFFYYSAFIIVRKLSRRDSDPNFETVIPIQILIFGTNNYVYFYDKLNLCTMTLKTIIIFILLHYQNYYYHVGINSIQYKTGSPTAWGTYSEWATKKFTFYFFFDRKKTKTIFWYHFIHNTLFLWHWSCQVISYINAWTVYSQLYTDEFRVMFKMTQKTPEIYFFYQCWWPQWQE